MPDSIHVAGHSMSPDSTQVILNLRDVVSKTAAFASLTKANKYGSIFLAKGITLPEAKDQFPLGRDMSKLLQWGSKRDAANKDGEALANIYRVEEIAGEVDDKAPAVEGE
jgi:hypothetical protein